MPYIDPKLVNTIAKRKLKLCAHSFLQP